MKKIGFLGPEGTFSHEAALKYSGQRGLGADKGGGGGRGGGGAIAEGINGSIGLTAYASIPDLMAAVDSGELEEAIFPIENSLEGGVIPTLDMLMEANGLRITGELTHEIHENLLVKRGTKKEDIELVISHSQPLGQCRKYLHENFGGVELKSVNSTSVAAETVKASDGTVASIGSAAAAKLYDLEILQSDIQDESGNITRFIVLGRGDAENRGRCKTSIIFSVGHTPGCLYKILGILDLWEINMSRIESRPAKGKLGKYIFYVDIEGHIVDPDIAEAMQMIKRKTTFFKFLGSYTAAE